MKILFTTLHEIIDYLDSKENIVIITDDNVLNHYFFIKGYNYISIKPGEDNKNLTSVNEIYSSLMKLECNRHTFLVGIGGGIVTDITGYVASTYMRGLNFALFPTTLLSMVDAAIGGKTGVNFDNYKNIIGSFYFPEVIGIYKGFLFSLPQEEIDCGFGEILKYAIGFDKKLFNMLDNSDINQFDLKDLKKILKRCIRIKSKIVSKDPEEHNIRKKLNLGHTIAHAIEKYTHEYKHGQAVAIGLWYMNNYCHEFCNYNYKSYHNIKNLLLKYFPDLNDLKLDMNNISQFIGQDKKSTSNDNIDIIIIDKIGSCKIKNIDKSLFKKQISSI